MFLFFSKTDLRKREKRETQQNRMVEAIRRKCQEAQQELAGFLQKSSERMSAEMKKCCLILFCVLGSIGCILITVQSWQAPVAIRAPVKIRMPVYVQRDHGNVSKAADSPDSLPQRIKTFQSYMDSLNRTAAGKIIHDSILSARPGLMDSITQFEQSPFK